MQLFCDRTGFPFLEAGGLGLAISLLPVTKVQFESFLAEPNEFGDDWYEQLLAVNPRASWRDPLPRKDIRLFLTGVQPEEAMTFTHWLGAGFDLPTTEEWRAVDRVLDATALNIDLLKASTVCPAARAILAQLLAQGNPRTWGELALLRGGVAEWVHWPEAVLVHNHSTPFGALGKPPGTTWAPHVDLPSRPIISHHRNSLFGFRPIFRWAQLETANDLWS